MDTIAKLFRTDDIKDVITKASEVIGDIDSIVIVYTTSDGLVYLSNCRRTQTVGLLETAKFDLLSDNFQEE